MGDLLSFHGQANGRAKAFSFDQTQSNMFFEKMIDGFAYHKIILDEAGKPIDYVFLEVNSAFEKMTGLEKKKIIGKKVTEVLNGIENDPADWIGRYGRVALTGEPSQFEDHAEPLDKWFHVSAYSPEKGYFVALFEDITDRKKTEEELWRTAERNYLYLEAGALGIYEYNFKTGTAFWDDHARQMLGIEKDKAPKYDGTLSSILPEDRKKVEVAIKRALSGKKNESYNVEHRVILPDNSTRWLAYRGQVYFEGEKSNRKPSRLIGVCMDITQRKKVEEELRRAKNDWERTFDTVPDFVAILDNKHRIIRANRAMAEQLGVTPQQAVGENCFKCVHGTVLPPEFCPHSKTLEDGKEHVAEVYEPKLGGYFIVSTTPLKDEGGQLIGSVHVARNITERKKSEDILQKLNRHLRAVSNSNQALMHATDETKFTQEVCEIIVHDCGYALAWVGFAENNKARTVRTVAFAGFDKDYIKQLNVTWSPKSPRGCGPTGRVIRTGKPYICKNMQTDPNFSPWRKEAIKRRYTASCVLPLLSQDGKVFGALNIYSQETNP
ncbi:MAG TPA: PAS domain S-box protein, partial [Candidatus Nanoarchaeia archaeon]|nr:PAS domain S-box protein [Candidatus Nanoarchaeia archaeon]